MKKANETVCRFLANLIVHTAEKKSTFSLPWLYV